MLAEMTQDDKTPRVVLFKGDDDFRKEKEVEELVRAVVSEDFADFDLERLEGDSVTCERIVTGLSVAPMGSKRRTLVIKRANKIPKEEQEKLAKALDSLPNSGCLVLVNPAVEKTDGRTKKSSEVIGELANAVRKAGAVRDISGGNKQMREADARRFALSLFEKAGKKADGRALAALITRAGTNLQILGTECEKLIAYAGDSGTITADDVDAVTTETPEEKVFKLVDALAAGEKPLTLKLLGELFEDSGDPRSAAPRVLSMIARQFRLIWQMKMLQAAGVKDFAKSSVPQEIRSRLPNNPNLLDVLSKQAWQREKITRQAAAFTREELSRCLLAAARADRMLKGIEGGIDDPMVVMELLAIELAAKPQQFARRR